MTSDPFLHADSPTLQAEAKSSSTNHSLMLFNDTEYDPDHNAGVAELQ